MTTQGAETAKVGIPILVLPLQKERIKYLYGRDMIGYIYHKITYQRKNLQAPTLSKIIVWVKT